jgi:hypothetical protein
MRWIGAGLVWILAGVVGLVGALLSVTVILLPLGIPLLFLARKLSMAAATLVMPPILRHPVRELDKEAKKASRNLFGRKRKSKVTRFVEWVLA